MITMIMIVIPYNNNNVLYNAFNQKKTKIRLVRINDEVKRATDPDYAPDGETGFADGFPFLIASSSKIQLQKV